ncbi:hypothetical protein [Nocardiopsis sp. NPDC057823]|uniref:hypothetical protein n=1 Tax=Nocardiopsis sp. NPDC057823 TaxID=3346256 RepID=UPI00366E99E9
MTVDGPLTTEGGGTLIAGNSGPVAGRDSYEGSAAHHGSGAQYVFTGALGAEASALLIEPLTRAKRPRISVTKDRLAELRARYVAPQGYDEEQVREELRRHGTVALSGDPGAGLGTVAHMTLIPAGHEGRRDLRRVDAEEWPRPALTVGTVDPDELLLLDLGGSPGTRPGRLRSELEFLVSEVRTAGAWMIVLVDTEDEAELPGELRDRCVRVRRPEPRSVILRHVRGTRIPPPHLIPDAVDAWARDAAMADITALVRRAEQEEGECADRLLAALGVDTDDVIREIAGYSGRRRAVLFTGAFLEGAAVEQHVAAVDRLMAEVRSPEDDTPPLERRSFTDELKSVGLRVDAERRVRFRSPGRAQAVRNAFWDTHPHLQGEFAAWVDTCTADPGMSDPEREDMARFWAAQVLRTRRSDALLARVPGWSQDRRASQAALILGEALKDAWQGAAARGAIYQWARNPRLDRNTARVLIAVCARDLVATHPDGALVRLHLLAENSDPVVAAEAVDVLAALVEDPQLYRALLRRVSGKLHGSDRRDRAVDRELFALLTDPERLVSSWSGPLAEQKVRTWIRAGLEGIFAHAPQEAPAHAERLFDAPEPMPGLLVEAAHGTGRACLLYATALRWPGRARDTELSSLRSERSRELLRRIDRAQGLDLEIRVPREEEKETR